jgi:hypothetical protein
LAAHAWIVIGESRNRKRETSGLVEVFWFLGDARRERGRRRRKRGSGGG